jgi:hypothetical protein
MSKRKWLVMGLALILVILLVWAGCIALPPTEQTRGLAGTWDLPNFADTSTPTATWVPGIWLFNFDDVSGGGYCPAYVQTAFPTAAPTGGAVIAAGSAGGSDNFYLCNTYATAVTLKVCVSGEGGGWSASAQAYADTEGNHDDPWGPKIGGGASTTNDAYCGEICGVDCTSIGVVVQAGSCGDFILQPMRKYGPVYFNVYHLNQFAGGTNCIGGGLGNPAGYGITSYQVSTFTPSPTPTYTPTPSSTPTPTYTPTVTNTPAVTATPTTCIYPPCVTATPTPLVCAYPPCETQTPGYVTRTPFAPTPYDTLTPLWTALP